VHTVILPVHSLVAVTVLGLAMSMPRIVDAAGPDAAKRSGILLLAHGGNPSWNEAVEQVAADVETQLPTEVAFGMADRTELQAAVDRLGARGVTSIVAVPLFVSSHSTVITATEYLLGLRDTAPPQLEVFARMRHGSGDARHPGTHGSAQHPAGHDAQASSGDAMGDDDRIRPVTTSIPITMTPALDRHPLVGAILLDRARAISRAPREEVVLLVAHGPVSEQANNAWLSDMAVLAQTVEQEGFARVECLTVRDDAPPEIWERAKAHLRTRVEAARSAGLTVLVVPHLLAFGGIEEGLKARLEGLDYRMSSQGLLPDTRLVDWVVEMASARGGLTSDAQ
jgi:CbiX